jgi:hypothetical protein
MRSSPSSVASSWWEVVSGAEVGAHMRRRWFCVGAKPGALLTRGCTACTPAATCPAIIQHPSPAPSPETPWRLGRHSSTNAGRGQLCGPRHASRSVVSSLAVPSPAWTRTSQ